MKKRNSKDRIFACVFPTGISYSDTWVEVRGDYKKLAHLFFDTLELEVEKDCPEELRPQIIESAARIQAQVGQPFNTSTSGQPITLGYKLKGTSE